MKSHGSNMCNIYTFDIVTLYTILTLITWKYSIQSIHMRYSKHYIYLHIVASIVVLNQIHAQYLELLHGNAFAFGPPFG